MFNSDTFIGSICDSITDFYSDDSISHNDKARLFFFIEIIQANVHEDFFPHPDDEVSK